MIIYYCGIPTLFFLPKNKLGLFLFFEVKNTSFDLMSQAVL
jgi:hypothetical protein